MKPSAEKPLSHFERRQIGLRRSKGPALVEHDIKGAHNQHQIAKEAPGLQVDGVELGALAKCGLTAPADLPQARDSGARQAIELVARSIVFDLFRQYRTWPDNAHVPQE